MKEITIEEIDLIQLKYTKFSYRYPDKIVISIGRAIVVFPNKFCEFLKIKDGSEILFAKNTSGFYICDATNKYKRGSLICHFLSKSSCKTSLKCNARPLIRLNIQKGVYEVEQEEYFDKKSSISWYKLHYIV